MKVSLNWIKEFTTVNIPVDELVRKIGAQLGAVEETVDLEKKYQGIVITKVVSCAPHPNADKLQVCTIDDGGITPDVKRDKNGHVQVVCGAPNVAAGMLVAWLPPGATVPSSYGKDPFVLESREIRGVVSNGMLASASELALSDDHSGILELDSGGAKPGDDFAQLYKLDDHIIDIENKMFTHRPDLFGILGIAREIAGIQHRPFKSPDWHVEKPKFLSAEPKVGQLRLMGERPEQVPRFMAAVLTDVEIKPSPIWLQSWLSRTGIRPINNVVDITNYVMYLTAQPLHAFDYEKVKAASGADGVVIGPRLAKKGEKLKLLSGKEIELDEQDIVIATDKNAVALAGVMGGTDTEVDENTRSIILECANFDMYAVRRTAMRHGLFTDAVTRFTKGQSPLQNDRVMKFAIELLKDIAGAEEQLVLDTDNHGVLRPAVAVHVTDDFINARLGLTLSVKEMAHLLENVEFEVAINGPTLVVTPPFWRTDIEIREDMVEEIGRLYGYDNLPLELPKRDLTPPPKNPMIELKDNMRSTLSSAGANELLTYSFVHGNLLEKTGQNKGQAFQLSNALSPDLQYYRLSMTPSLLDKVHPNIKAGYGEFAIYEIGTVHNRAEKDDEGLPKEFDRLAVVFTADEKVAKAKYTGAAYYEAQRYLTLLFDKLGIGRHSLAPGLPEGGDLIDALASPYDTTRSATVKIGLSDSKKVTIGIIGEFKPAVQKALKLPYYSAGFELDISAISIARSRAKESTYKELSKFPKTEQDISLKVPADLAYSDLLSHINKVVDEIKPRETVTDITPVDIYQNESDTKHKHITLRLSIVSYERTLTDKEVNSLLEETAQAAKKKFGAARL